MECSLQRFFQKLILEGLGSYAVVLMTTAFLSLHQFRYESNLGKVFYQFLKFFGKELNSKENGIAFDKDKAFLFPIPSYNQNCKFTILDPLNPGYNLTRKAEKVEDIFSKFNQTYSRIETLSKNLEEYVSLKIEKEKINFRSKCKSKCKEEILEGLMHAENLVEKFVKHEL